MSDHFLLFVPVDPYWQPTQADADRAVVFFKSIALYPDDVIASFSDEVEFHHPYQNWEGVCCPACSADLEDWFYATLCNTDLKDLMVLTPCCELKTSLNDLDFTWPAAFGRFVLEAMNPNVIPDEAQDKEIAARIGSEVRKIWRHL